MARHPANHDDDDEPGAEVIRFEDVLRRFGITREELDEPDPDVEPDNDQVPPPCEENHP